MASVWIENARGDAAKLNGHLSPAKAILAFRAALKGYKAAGWKAETEGRYDAVLTRKGPFGLDRCYLYVEYESPSSKPEPGQPRVWGEAGCVLVKRGEAAALIGLKLPPGPPEAAH